MKIAVNICPKNGMDRTLVYEARDAVEAALKALEEHPTWQVKQATPVGKWKEEPV